MAEMLLCDRLEELWLLIDQQHLLFLELEESSHKLEQRNKLESYIKEYLCLAPHDRKFTLHQTAEVLHRSASTKDNFSAYKAGLAWRAIGKYADNLVVQPWRKEYRDIKLYCGFYKHEIEESLVGAEMMFEAMGYRHLGHSTMCLPDVLDPDRVTSVSKDAIVAYVECQILKHIWESISAYHFTWLDVLEFRQNHPGTPDQAVRALTYKVRQRQYQEQCHRNQHHARPDRPDCLQHSCVPTSRPPHHNTMSYYNHAHYPNPAYTRYGPMLSPQQVMSPPLYPYQAPHHVIKPHDLYPANGYHVHYQTPSAMHNGYGIPPHQHAPPAYQGPSTVPTAQLIELDTGPSSYQKHDPRWHATPALPPMPVLPEPVGIRSTETHFPVSKARDDGAGSWENWDFVYRNLESHGYKKDLGSRGDVLHHQSSTSQNNSSSQADVSPSDISDKLRKVTLESVAAPPKPADPATNKVRTDGDGEAKIKTIAAACVTECQVDGPREQIPTSKLVASEVKPNRIIPDKSKRDSVRRSSEGSGRGRLDMESEVRMTVNLDAAPPEKNKSRSRTPEPTSKAEKWECISCTFLNSANRDICEMCCKSKERGSELKPQPSGGQVCSKCTLVNEPKLMLCAACDTPLKDSPTYV